MGSFRQWRVSTRRSLIGGRYRLHIIEDVKGILGLHYQRRG